MHKDSIEADLNKHFSRYEDPLWDEYEEELQKQYIEIKITKPRGVKTCYSWKFFDSGKQVLAIESTILTKKQLEYLLSAKGVQFLIGQYKAGVRTVTGLKKSLQLVDDAKSYNKRS